MSDFSTIQEFNTIPPNYFLLLGKADATNPGRISTDAFLGSVSNSDYHIGPTPPTDGTKLWFRTDGLGNPIDFWVLYDGEWRSITKAHETRYLIDFTSRTTDAYVGLEIAGLDKRLRVYETLMTATAMQNDSDNLVIDLEAYIPGGAGRILHTETFGPFTAGQEYRAIVALNELLNLNERLRFRVRPNNGTVKLAGVSVAAAYRLVYQ